MKYFADSPQFDDLSRVTQTVDFAYEEIDRRVFGVDSEPLPLNSRMDVSSILECQRQIWLWVYQPPCKDFEGFVCRSVVACWVFVPELRGYTMTEMAGRVGKKKQSLGRWVDDFKKQFPEVAKHLQHIRNT